MLNCEKFIFYGYENKQECLLANEPTTTEPFMTGLTNQQSTSAETTSDHNPAIIIILTIIAVFGFLGLGWCILKRLIVREIVRRYTDAMKTKFKASKLKAAWDSGKNKKIAKDLNFIAKMRNKIAKKTSDLESQTEQTKTVSHDE